jgi:predicted porin
MQKLLLVFLISCIAITTYAQGNGPQANSTVLSIGAELNIPQQSRYTIGYGASAKFELPIINAFSLTLTGGLHQYHIKSIFDGASTGNDTFIPLKAGVKYYFDPRFYTEGELGTVIDHNDAIDQNRFTYAIGTGFLLPLNNSRNMVNVGLRYEQWSQNRLQQVGIRVAYRFGL